MNMVHHKTRLFLLLIFTFSILTLPGTAFAADEKCENAKPIDSPKKFTCADLNCPHSEFIISILEENIGTETSFSKDDQTNIINCVRQTKCYYKTADTVESDDASTDDVAKQLSNKEIECTSSYTEVGECTPSGAIGGEAEFCDRVQAIVSKSGLSMLFSYIGLIYRWSAGLVGVISVMFLIYGGLRMMTAGDNTENIDKAKAKIVQSLAGLALLFLSAIILYTINPTFFTL